MPTIFRTNNPTKVQRIDKAAISLRIIRNGESRSFYIERLDHATIQLPSIIRIGCLAIAGQTVQYFDLGTVEKTNFGTFELSEIAEGAAVRFRLMFYDPETAKILASAENIRSSDEDSPSPSLISIEPTNLGGPIWRLELPPDTGDAQPTLLVEQKLFPFAKAVMTDKNFLALVLPEAVRQIATSVARLNPDSDSDECWTAAWDKFFKSLGVSEKESQDDEASTWIDDCVKAFCRRGNMVSILEKTILGEGAA
jgi:hypothetical protein